MTRTTCIAIIALSFSMFFQVFPVSGQEEQKKQEWTGKLGDGKILTKNELENILTDHKKWIETNWEEGERTNLSKANLSGANLSGANLSKADLLGAYLSGANLSGANLSKAVLLDANLSDANLSGANLRRANLSIAYLSRANLHEVNLIKANLSGANLSGANLSKAVLYGSQLPEAVLYEAKLSRADLSGANLSKADLRKADLSKAVLSEANLSKADLSEADLKDCVLNSGTQLPLIYEPKAGSSPYIPSIATFPNLSRLTFKDSPHGLVDLREGFKKFGYREQEREITFAINHTKRLKLWNDKESSLRNKTESIFYYIFFEVTCQYGMNPGRALTLLIPLIIIFAIPYTIILISPFGKDGIWKAWRPERARKDLGSKDPYRLNLKLIAALGFGLYFSFLSAFSIGWRELNVGNWIARLQRREYNLRATGWMRTVSGLQSLISVYLLALWALTYFGRPFEAV